MFWAFWFFFIKKIGLCFTKKCHFLLNLLTMTLIYWDSNNFQAGNLQASRSVLLEFFLGRYLFNKMDSVKLIHLWTSNPVYITYLLFKLIRSYWDYKCDIVNARKTCWFSVKFSWFERALGFFLFFFFISHKFEKKMLLSKPVQIDDQEKSK